mgnify:CR=1 FL=1
MVMMVLSKSKLKKIVIFILIVAFIILFKEKFKLNIKYPVKDFYEWHHKLTGSCAMGRDNFAEYNNIDVKNDKMTVQEFIKLTQNSFGGDVIKQLAKEMKVKIEN